MREQRCGWTTGQPSRRMAAGLDLARERVDERLRALATAHRLPAALPPTSEERRHAESMPLQASETDLLRSQRAQASPLSSPAAQSTNRSTKASW
eukprot:5127074-Pleurochrysis_carterae.AAC.2